ncbi:MAG: hypothetical protein CMF57_13210, partial [Leifsonia sp.]|jgi:hypothetical protein|nr:hypothetical protein [Leifsonia sp.]
MATRYSDHFSATGDDGDPLDMQVRVSAGISHGRLRYKRARANGLFTTADVVRMMTFKSSDRLIELWLGWDGANTAGAVTVGLCLSGSNHSGAPVDWTLFGVGLATTTLARRQGLMVGGWSADLVAVAGEEEVRGLPLWKQASYGSGTDTEDPMTEYDIVIAPSTTLAGADSIMTLEAYYTSGD